MKQFLALQLHLIMQLFIGRKILCQWLPCDCGIIRDKNFIVLFGFMSLLSGIFFYLCIFQ